MDARRDIRLIAAVGKSGQIGFKGELPWKDPEDLAWFRTQTMGGVVVVGMKTYATLPPLPGRIVVPYGRGLPEPEPFLERLDREYPDKLIWIAGGEATYRIFMPYVRRSIVTHILYDGPADTFMPNLWS